MGGEGHIGTDLGSPHKADIVGQSSHHRYGEDSVARQLMRIEAEREWLMRRLNALGAQRNKLEWELEHQDNG